MHVIDWLVMVLPLIVVAAIAVYARRFVRSVADFMAGGRNAGRFLLCTAKSEMGAGAVSYVTGFEVFSRGGFSFNWWSQLAFPVTLLVTISGFVIYRYRQTRALTLAQFFEMRYSRRFRLFAGALAFFAGLVNFGIMPLVNAMFMVYFLGFPEKTHLAGLNIPTYLIFMAINLSITALITTLGGQITVLVIDCIEGLFSQLSYVIITVAVLFLFSWSETRAMLLNAAPGQSLVNPFDSFSIKDFNIWYVLMSLAINAYATMAWQNQHAFNSSAASPHESRMGGILGNWRNFAGLSMKYMLVVFAMTWLANTHGAGIQEALDQISSEHTRQQMRIPVALAHVLPLGIKGLFVSILMMGIFAADGQHLHSWSSIFIQDIILPLRKKPLTLRQHLIVLRLGVIGVALCAFLFGALFQPTEYVAMWWIITEAIFTGGAGAAIIGGLYWSRGTSAGAWAGLLGGSTLCFGGLLVRQFYGWLMGVALPYLGLTASAARLQHDYPQFPLNPREISFYAAIIAVLSYVLVSLLTCRKAHNMDSLLHRGQYAVEAESTEALAADPAPSSMRKKRFHLYNLIGITQQFTRGDRWMTLGIFGWHSFWMLVFLLGSAAYLLHPWSNRAWADYWIITSIYVPLLLGIVTTIWFTYGVTRDLRIFFQRLRKEHMNTDDDGTVQHTSESSGNELHARAEVPAKA